MYQPLWLFSLYLGINHRFALGLTDCFQVPRISATNQALYTPGDEQAGLARPGESVAFSLRTNNSGNVDLHHVHLLPKAGEHELAVCCLRMSRRIALVLRECGRYACSVERTFEFVPSAVNRRSLSYACRLATLCFLADTNLPTTDHPAHSSMGSVHGGYA